MLRHCTMTELLEVRDGHGSAAARAHVGECVACRAELDRLHRRMAALKALPQFTPPRDRWPAVRAAFTASRRRTRVARVAWSGLAAAAVLVLAVGVRGLSNSSRDATSVQQLEALVQESQRLEDVLRSVSVDGRVASGLTAAAIVELEDRIAVIDASIGAAQVGPFSEDDVRDLWRERVTTMDALVNTHVRQVAYVGF